MTSFTLLMSLESILIKTCSGKDASSSPVSEGGTLAAMTLTSLTSNSWVSGMGLSPDPNLRVILEATMFMESLSGSFWSAGWSVSLGRVLLDPWSISDVSSR